MAYVGMRKSIRQKLAWMLSAAIVVTSLSFGGATARAEENNAEEPTIAAGTYSLESKASADDVKVDGLSLDAEAFNWGNSHGIQTKAADTVIELNLEENANLTVTTCRYGVGASGTMTSSTGTVSSTQIEEGTGDGNKAPVFTVTGASGKTTLTFANNMYVHSIKVEYVAAEEEAKTIAAGTYSLESKATADDVKVDGLSLDAEAFNWGNSHGIQTKAADTVIELNLEENANLTVTTCRYGVGASGTMTSSTGTVSSTQIEEGTGDGNKAPVFTVTGASGKTTLTFANNMYVHSIKVEYVAAEEEAKTIAAGTYSLESKATADDVKVDGLSLDAEAFNWGNSHGIQTKAADTVIELNLEENANLTVTTCRYGVGASGTMTSSTGTVSSTQIEEGTGDGNKAPVFTVTGASGKTTLTFANNMYVHSIKVEYVAAEEEAKTIAAGTYSLESKATADDVKVDGLSLDAEAFNWGNSHGIQTKAADTVIELNLEENANLTVTTCRYGVGASGTMTSSTGTVSSTQIEEGTGDGNKAPVFTVTGASGKTTLTFANNMYIHSIKVEYVEPDDDLTDILAIGTHSFSLKPKADIMAIKGMKLKADDYNDYENKHGMQTAVPTTITLNLEEELAEKSMLIVTTCGYSSGDAASRKLTSSKGTVTTSVIQEKGNDAVIFTVSGAGGKTALTFTAGIYIHSIEYRKGVDLDTNKLDVWDFGAETVEGANNLLNVGIINAFYSEAMMGDKPAGSSGLSIDQFSANDADGLGAIKFVSDKTNNRIRTTNEAISRYDEKSLAGDDGKTYTGYVYSNSSSTSATRLEIYLYSGDTLTCMLGSNGNAATYILLDPDGKEYDTFNYAGKSGVETAVFHAAAEGWYQLYCSDEKLVCARITREHAAEVQVSGTVTVPENMPAGYGLIFTNTATGQETEVNVTSGAYTCTLFGGYSYDVSLKGANGFVIKENASLTLGKADATLNPVVEAVTLNTITGEVTGLPAAELGKVELIFNIPEGKVYIPELTLNRTTGEYTLKVENGVEYSVVAEKVNDYTLVTSTVSATSDKTADIEFNKKAVYPVTLTITGVADSSNAVATFTNIDEEGYVYTFPVSEKMELRDGSYSVKVSGLGNYAVVQGVTPNVNVKGAAASTTVPFKEISTWDFAQLEPVVEVETIGESRYYAGLEVGSGVAKNKVYLLANAGNNVKIPNVQKGDKVTIKYCYSAAFKVGDMTVDESSGSTGRIDSVSVVAAADGDLVIESITGEKASQTYFCAIEVQKASDTVAYSDMLYVGADKEYKTINDALAAVRKMARTADQKVTIMIDPGNYEEMLVVDTPNITLKNASAEPSIALKNKGVDIDDNAVRVTWYYGHGYTYYSMGSDCKYDAELLAANKSNGYASFKNPGSGTTNGSYWNATVVITADDFNAEGIIFENSFNQYVSAKSVEDVIEAQSGAKEGTVHRADMKTVGDTKVQEKEYVERAAALAIYNNVQKVYFNNCKFIGRQDTLYGGTGVTAGFENCSIYGGTDYIFGGMTAVFKQCDLVFNTNDQTSKGEKDDVGYITAAQQSSGRGYLMYGCTVTSTVPGVDTASNYTSKPGYLGRPWQAHTGEAVFYMTTIDKADEHWKGSFGDSLIRPEGWLKTLGGESELSVEYGTVEMSGVDNSAKRASWASVLTAPTLADGSPIAIRTFLGDWNPFRTSELVVIPDEESAAVGMLGVTATEDVVFTNEAGEEVTGEIDIKAVPTTATAAIMTALAQDMAAEKYEAALTMYLDVSAYLKTQGTETPVQLASGKVWIKFSYPEGMSQENEIVVFHNTTKLAAGDVKQDAKGYQFAADGFSPYTIVFKEIPGEPTPDDPTPVDPKPEEPTPDDPQPVNPGNSDDDNDDGGEAEVIEQIDWEKVAAQIDDAAKSKAPKNLDVTSGDRYEVPVKVLNKLKGKNTTLALHAGGGITLSITGTDIKKNVAAPLKVAMSHGNVIPAGAANQVLAGATANRMFSMEDKSVYPFPVNVHVNLGASNAGKTAYMYYYDEKSNSMVLAGSFRITATGQAMFAIYRGDEYIIAVSDKAAAVKGKYIVVKGDNLTYIAKKTGVTLKKLIGANPQIKNVNRIMPGQEINLP